MNGEREQPPKLVTLTRFGIPLYRRSLRIGESIRLDYADTKVGKAGLIFNMATQTVFVHPYRDNQPVLVYTKDGEREELVGRKAIANAQISGVTKKGKRVKII